MDANLELHFYADLEEGFPIRTYLPRQETLGTQVQSLGWEDPLEEGMATHSSTHAGKIPWTEEPGGL